MHMGIDKAGHDPLIGEIDQVCIHRLDKAVLDPHDLITAHDDGDFLADPLLARCGDQVTSMDNGVARFVLGKRHACAGRSNHRSKSPKNVIL